MHASHGGPSAATAAAALALAALAALSACGDAPGDLQPLDPDALCEDGDEAEQRRGTDCLCCHDGEFSVAGSIARGDAGVASIRVTDAEGVALVMTPNGFGNFFRHARVTPPLRAALVDAAGHVVEMKAPAPHGACNRCHREGGAKGPLGAP